MRHASRGFIGVAARIGCKEGNDAKNRDDIYFVITENHVNKQQSWRVSVTSNTPVLLAFYGLLERVQ